MTLLVEVKWFYMYFKAINENLQIQNKDTYFFFNFINYVIFMYNFFFIYEIILYIEFITKMIR